MTTGGPQRQTTVAGRSRPLVVERFLTRHPELRAPAAAVLAAGERLRAARRAAFAAPGLPARRTRPGFEAAREELRHRVDRLAALAGRARAGGLADGDPRVRSEVDRLLVAVTRLRLASHALSPRRRSASRPARAELFAALRRFQAAWTELEAGARRSFVGRVPWQLELSCLADPGLPMAELEITGNDLPGLPAARLPWGERCWLTGDAYHTDSRRRPAMRYRSLESCHTLSPEANALVARLAAALRELRAIDPEAAEIPRRMLPFLFHDYVAADSHPSFARLGLLDFPSLAVSLNNMLRAYSERPFLGMPADDGGCEWRTFAEVRDLALRLAHGLAARRLAPGDRVGIVSPPGRWEFYLADFACVFARLVSFALPAGRPAERTVDSVSGSRLNALVVDAATLDGLLGAGLATRCPDLETVVLLPGAPPAVEAPAGGPRVTRLEEVLAAAGDSGHRLLPSGIAASTPILYDDEPGHRAAAAAGILPDNAEDLYTVLFTSGSTGESKGTPFSRHRWRRETRSEATVWPYVGVSFQPSAAAADRASVWRALHNGGRVGFIRPGAAFFARVRALRPTVFDAPPAIWNTIYADYKRAIANAALDGREAAVVRWRFRRHLGGRLAFMATGGAPGCEGVNRAMERIFGIPMAEGYGTTETGQIAANGELVPGLDFRLVDRPEHGCRVDHQPHPRGELAVRAPDGLASWAGDGGSPAHRVTEDGYFLTGDLVELGPGRRVKVLGRCHEVLKLASAERLSPEVLEGHYQSSEAVEAVILTGLPSRNELVAVVVPTRDDLGAAGVLAELRAIAANRGLTPAATPVGAVVVPRREGRMPWRPDNGLLTPTFKPNRRAIARHYADQIAAAYESPVAAGEGGAASGGARTTGDPLRALAATLLAVSVDAIDMRRSFVANGADSLRTMELALRLEDLYGGKAGDHGLSEAALVELAELPLADLARRLGAVAVGGEPGGAQRRQPAAVVGEDSPRAPDPVAPVVAAPAAAAEPEVIARRANADAAATPPDARGLAVGGGRDVLLTGATGFLGVHLLAELARGAGADGARVYALVRARDHAAAGRRLAGALESADLAVPRIGRPGDTAGAPVVAIAGSVAEPRMGLDPGLWSRLAERLGLIHHLAAVVTAERSYDELRRANVGGTRRVLELATTGGLKALHFVSSLNVALIVAQLAGREAGEAAPLPARLPPALVAAHPAYAISKWVGERQVQALFDQRPDWPVSISRPALLGWSSESGFGNRHDILHKVLTSCLVLRAVPAPEAAGVPSWVAETETSLRGIDLVPVDFAARAMARLGAATRRRDLPTAALASADRVPTFHVSNLTPGERGLTTLTRLFDLLIAADLERRAGGERHQPIAYVPGSEWLARVEIEGAPALAVLDRLGAFDPTLARVPAARFAAAVDGGPRCPPIDTALALALVGRAAASERGGQR